MIRQVSVGCLLLAALFPPGCADKSENHAPVDHDAAEERATRPGSVFWNPAFRYADEEEIPCNPFRGMTMEQIGERAPSNASWWLYPMIAERMLTPEFRRLRYLLDRKHPNPDWAVLLEDMRRPEGGSPVYMYLLLLKDKGDVWFYAAGEGTGWDQPVHIGGKSYNLEKPWAVKQRVDLPADVRAAVKNIIAPEKEQIRIREDENDPLKIDSQFADPAFPICVDSETAAPLVEETMLQPFYDMKGHLYEGFSFNMLMSYDQAAKSSGYFMTLFPKVGSKFRFLPLAKEFKRESVELAALVKAKTPFESSPPSSPFGDDTPKKEKPLKIIQEEAEILEKMIYLDKLYQQSLSALLWEYWAQTVGKTRLVQTPETAPSSPLWEEPAEPGTLHVNWKTLSAEELSELLGREKPKALSIGDGRIVGAAAKGLAGTEGLEALRIFRTDITDAELANFRGLENLKELNLSSTPIYGSGLKHFAASKNLEHLNVQASMMDDAGASYLPQFKRLKSLYLLDTKITDRGTAFLKSLPALEALTLSETRITDNGLANVKALAKLKFLSLNETAITDKGMKHLSGLKKLSTLRLGNTNITDRGLAEISNLKELEILGLGGAKITGDGLSHLKELKKLKALSLGGTLIADKGLEHLNALPKLEFLNLYNTPITDAGLERLKGMTQLKRLELDKTRITKAGYEALKKALPNTKISRPEWPEEKEDPDRLWRFRNDNDTPEDCGGWTSDIFTDERLW